GPWLSSCAHMLQSLTRRSAPFAGGPWAAWRLPEAYTVGLEEEVMLLDPDGWELTQRGVEVLSQAGEALAGHCAAETHEAALELKTGPHGAVRDAINEMRELRRLLARDLARLGMAGACAGMYPGPTGEPTRVSPSS